MVLWKALLLKLLAVVVAACIWLPCVHLLYPVSVSEYREPGTIAPKAQLLANRHLTLWGDPTLRRLELESMQKINPEWDFMSRTYFVLALANMALADPACTEQACDIMDAILENTLRIEKEEGPTYFLLGYANRSSWVMQPVRSQFVDGEIAIMLAARRLVKEHLPYRLPLQERVRIMVGRMKQSPVLSAESYPDECWLFCNTVSLAAIRLADALDGTDHSAFLRDWVATAKKKLTEPETGILITSYAVSGKPAPSGWGPEGSTIWMAAHMLELVDPDYAQDQYRRARKELGHSFLNFGYSREWPVSCEGTMDVDSGPVIPGLGASASASGLAILAASSFDDPLYLESLLRSLEFAGFPKVRDGQLFYRASNPVGDAVLLYALVEGPLWRKVMEGGK